MQPQSGTGTPASDEVLTMAFTLQHILVSNMLDVVRHENGPEIFFTVAAEDSFYLLYPGRLQKPVQATVRHSTRIDPPNTTVSNPAGGIDDPTVDPHPTDPTPRPPPHSGVQVNDEGIPLDLRIFDPNGQLFTRDE